MAVSTTCVQFGRALARSQTIETSAARPVNVLRNLPLLVPRLGCTHFSMALTLQLGYTNHSLGYFPVKK